MTAGEVRRAGAASAGRSATHAIPRGLSALGEADTVPFKRDHGEAALADTLAALIEADPAIGDPARQALQALLQRHRQLVADVARLRRQREEWVVSALTYKALYQRYSGHSPQEPNDRLMQERECMRRTIRERLRDGSAPTATPSHSIDPVSIS